jgi:hypothetical protein
MPGNIHIYPQISEGVEWVEVKKEEWPTFQFHSRELVCPYETSQQNAHVSPFQLHLSDSLALVCISFYLLAFLLSIFFFVKN